MCRLLFVEQLLNLVDVRLQRAVELVGNLEPADQGRRQAAQHHIRPAVTSTVAST